MSSREFAVAAKERGNTAFSSGDFAKAITEFSEAIRHDPNDHIFYSNRSAAYASLNNYDLALTDAETTITLNPQFVKGHTRRAAALVGLKRYDDALVATNKALEIDPNNAQAKDTLQSIKQAQSTASNPMAAMFGPDMWSKLMADPVTKAHLSDPQFVQTMNEIQQNPSSFGNHAKNPKVAQALGVLFGLGANAFNQAARGGAGGPRSNGNPADFMNDDDDDDDDGAEPHYEAKSPPPSSHSHSHAPPKPSSTAHKPTPKPDTELTPEERTRREADLQKEKGNQLFKLKKFTEAIEAYNQAIQLDGNNIVYYNNVAACYYELKQYEECIKAARQAIEISQNSSGVSYKDVAKAWSRIGNAYAAQKQYADAIEAYQKSLIEDSHQDKVKEQLKKVTEHKRKYEAEQYLDVAKSDEHKEKGNQLFADAKYADAITEYTEALKRNPDNYKVYSNRAACYTKLMDWQRGLDDCEACLARDSKFVKAYIRKGKIQHFLKQYHKALDTFSAGLALDPSSSELIEAKQLTMQAINSGTNDPERAKEAMKDPEIQQILRDPTIGKVLQDLQSNPASGQAALQDKDIRAKIEKLIAAGVLAVK